MRVRARADDTDSWNLLTNKCSVNVEYFEEKKKKNVPKITVSSRFIDETVQIFFRPREFFAAFAADVPFYLLIFGEIELKNSMTPNMKMNENSLISIKILRDDDDNDNNNIRIKQ